MLSVGSSFSAIVVGVGVVCSTNISVCSSFSSLRSFFFVFSLYVCLLVSFMSLLFSSLGYLCVCSSFRCSAGVALPDRSIITFALVHIMSNGPTRFFPIPDALATELFVLLCDVYEYW